ncbi:ATP-grasp domain-containing protein [Corynebacterium hadale]|uniref:ATP-grasp domain-containing protein n=1 Tax=Corynebacterium hadale TaxID=2026255 RepID=UPI0013FD840F|nr:ATP-grasp domain-containing protein [Corynebacterium hadale]
MSYEPSNLISLIQSEILEPGLTPNLYQKKESRTRLMLREAKRRGWETVKVKDGTWVFLSGGRTIGGTVYHGASTQSIFARRVSNDKTATKLILEANGVPTPRGAKFTAETELEAFEYFERQNRPVVVKPNGGTRGRGVSLNVKNTAAFKRAWRKAASAGYGDEVVVEEYFAGFDVRVLVIGGRARVACSRLNAFVVGDGHHTVADLIDLEEQRRQQDAYLKNTSISVDEEWLEVSPWKLDAIPAEGELVVVNPISSVGGGGFTLNLFEKLSRHHLAVAEKAAAAFVGTGTVGVDLFTSSLEPGADTTVLEINTQPFFDIHHYVSFGEPVNAVKCIMDQIERTSLLYV